MTSRTPKYCHGAWAVAKRRSTGSSWSQPERHASACSSAHASKRSRGAHKRHGDVRIIAIGLATPQRALSSGGVWRSQQGGASLTARGLALVVAVERQAPTQAKGP